MIPRLYSERKSPSVLQPAVCQKEWGQVFVWTLEPSVDVSLTIPPSCSLSKLALQVGTTFLKQAGQEELTGPNHGRQRRGPEAQHTRRRCDDD